ncbi:P-loop NTPase fold protein [Flavobacterium johnsoniae]|uniref:P-loop NTPase fold protein n=1 Tax=Flavobacterium johnsoniae TaxID=986 RepID=UPI003D9547E9
MADNSKTETIKEYKFLINQPLGEDLFKNRSQDKIATVISEKIINDVDFKIIGIDGAWGSGKSNLVKLIENKLSNSHNFFIYDVWGHQEDEQRKAILVELTEFLTSEVDLLKKGSKDWNVKLTKLLANSKETTTINQPYLSVGFIFSLLSIIYIPTVNVFKDSMANFFQIEKLFWKLVLVAFPIFIVLAIYTYNFLKNWINKNGFWKSFKISAEETFQVYTNKQKEETKIETISENQPSVRDFQKWMKEIDDDLNKKIVIVFDNFDRLPKKHILNIWSSIHIFFAEKKYTNIKILLPFDREHVQNAFKELNSNSDDKTFGDDYVNKTFDIVFRVTLPIMSDWKIFFENQWKNAFTEYDNDELKLVIQAYEFLNRRITPREIISFINEILTIKLLDENFKERYIAIFILKKDDILKDPLKSVTELDYLKGLKSIYHNDSNFAKQITAIIYHIEVEEALELIYTQELKDSLNRNDVEQFNNICKSEFIDTIFTQAILDIEIPENPIKTLSKLDSDTNLTEFNILQAWKTLYFKVLNKESNVDKLEIEDWQVLLIQNYDNDQFLSYLLKNFLNLLNDTNTIEYITLIDEIIDSIGSDRVLNLIPEKKIKPENFIEITENKGSQYNKYRLTTNEKEIDSYISKLKIEEILELKNTKVLNDNFNLKTYKGFLKTNLNIYVDQNNIQIANDIITKLKETYKVNGDLKDVLDESRIYSLYANNPSSNLPVLSELIAMRIAKGENFTTYGHYFQPFLDTENKKLASEISLTILNYIGFGSLLILSDFFKNSLLYKDIARVLIMNTSLQARANILELINTYNNIKSNIEINDGSLLKQLNRWEIDKTKFEIEKLDDQFILDCLEYDNLNISKVFIEKFNESFKNMNQDAYEVLFDNERSIHFRYFENLNSESLTQISLDIFQDRFSKKLKEDKVSNQWWKIFKKYESNHNNLSIISTLRTLRDGFLTAKTEITLETAEIILPYFIKHNILQEKSDVFRTIIKNIFLNDKGFVNMLKENSDSIKLLYQNSPQDDKDGFRNTINEKRDEIDSIEDLAKLLDIRKSKK